MAICAKVFPATLINSLTLIGVKLALGKRPTAYEIDTLLDLLSRLPPDQIASADGAIAAAANLYRRHSRTFLERVLYRRLNDQQLLQQTPGLEYLIIFHRDGRLRAAALAKMTGGLPNPFLFAAVLWRLNDWAAPVRDAAVSCASRLFPSTDPVVVARVAIALQVRQASWGRWKDERSILNELLGRAEVAKRMAELLCTETTGHLTAILRCAVRTPALDQHLEQLAFGALQPFVRAVALEALINGTAVSPAGYGWQWIDKSMGLRRRVAVFDRRTLSIVYSKEQLIARGIHDRSAVVRRVVLDGVMQHLSGTPQGRLFATMLVTDNSPSVRERAAFILRCNA